MYGVENWGKNPGTDPGVLNLVLPRPHPLSLLDFGQTTVSLGFFACRVGPSSGREPSARRQKSPPSTLSNPRCLSLSRGFSGIEILALLVTGCVTLSKSLHFLKSWFLYLQNGDHTRVNLTKLLCGSVKKCSGAQLASNKWL